MALVSAAFCEAVGGEHMAALRAFLTDDDAFDRISALLDEDGSWSAYAALAVAAFGVAARRRFPGGYKADDVIRFVGRRSDMAKILASGYR